MCSLGKNIINHWIIEKLVLEGNLGCLYANLLLNAGGSDQIAEGFEQAQLGLTPPRPGWSHTASGSSAPVPDHPQGENSRGLNLSSFSFCPECLICPAGTAVKSLAPYIWQPPHGHWLGLLSCPPKAFPSPDWTSPAPSAPLQGHAPAFTISVSQLHSLHSANLLCWGCQNIQYISNS